MTSAMLRLREICAPTDGPGMIGDAVSLAAICVVVLATLIVPGLD